MEIVFVCFFILYVSYILMTSCILSLNRYCSGTLRVTGHLEHHS